MTNPFWIACQKKIGVPFCAGDCVKVDLIGAWAKLVLSQSGEKAVEEQRAHDTMLCPKEEMVFWNG